MKNFLSIENLVSHESLPEIIQSSSEMEGYPITNILESEEKSIWLSTEELPQEITINLFKSLFKEFPTKISAIGIYCWHAYPTNPKLIEVQISKNSGINFVSLGNFDLCLKPGRQLLQLEDDSDYILPKDIYNDNLIIKLIIKETFGDKRTYINNIYLYEDIKLYNKNIVTNMETIKEEDSNSVVFLRESRERTLPKSNFKEKVNGLFDIASKDLIEIDFDVKSEDIKNKNNENNENKNKFLGIDNEFMMSDSELSEKNQQINQNNSNEKTAKENKIINDKEEVNNNLNINNNNINNMKSNDRYFNEKMSKDLLNYDVIIAGKEEHREFDEKEKSLNINDFNEEEENENENDNENNNEKENYDYNTNNIQNEVEKDLEDKYNDSYKEEDINEFIEEFENYKKLIKERKENYEKKLNFLENQFKEMTALSNKMSNTINTILESQMNLKKENHDNLLNSMRAMINEKIGNVFRNYNIFSSHFFPPMGYPMGNEYNIPFNYNMTGNSNFEYNTNINSSLRKSKLKNDKQLKNKKNIISKRNKSSKNKISKKKINALNNIHKNNGKKYSQNSINNNSLDGIGDNNIHFNNEYDFQNYPLQLGVVGNDVQNFPFIANNKNKRNTIPYNNNTLKINNGRNTNNKLNSDYNDYMMKSKTQRTQNERPTSNDNQYFEINKNNNNISQGDLLSQDNEIDQVVDDLLSNIENYEKTIESPIDIEKNNNINLTEVKKDYNNKENKNKARKNKRNLIEKKEINFPKIEKNPKNEINDENI